MRLASSRDQTRRFIPGFASIAAPLHQLLTVGNEKYFVWNEACDRAFLDLKCLAKAPVFSFPQFDLEYILDTDASDTGIGAVLFQVHDGLEKVIAYASRTLTKSERNYSTTKRETLALVNYSWHFRHYLYGRKFIARTDYDALRWLTNFKEPSGQVKFDLTQTDCPGDPLTWTVCDLSYQQSVPLPRETPLSPTELRHVQMNDPTVGPVLVWRKQKSETPTQNELQGTGLQCVSCVPTGTR